MINMATIRHLQSLTFSHSFARYFRKSTD